jgi:MFS family permease
VDRRSGAGAALAASVAGYAVDGFDLLILSFMLPAIAAGLALTPAEAGSLLTATLVGAVAGGILFGVLADRFGRVRVLGWSILLFSVATGACGLARDFGEMIAARGVAGLGLGGEFGIGMTLVAEAWPPVDRARATSYVGLGWQAGALAAALLTPLLLPLVGWRGVFLLGMVPGLLSFAVRRFVPEPDMFRQRRRIGAPLRTLSLLVEGRRRLLSSLAVFILCAIQNFGYFGLMIWLPAYLSKTLGFSLTRSGLWTAATILGMCLGILAFGEVADRLGRRPAFMLFQAGAAIMVFAYAQLASPAALLVGGAVMGFFANGMIGGYGALIAELFPTEARSTAQNVLFNLGRGVGGVGPLVIGAVAAAYSLGFAIALLSAIYVVDILVTATLIPETKGQRLA